MRSATLQSLVVSLIVLAANVLGGIALARSLGPYGRGELASLVVWAAIASTIATLGTTGALTYFTARSETTGESAVRKTSRAYPLMSVAGLALFAVFAIGGNPVSGAALVITAVSVPLRTLLAQVQAYLRGRQNFGRYNWNRLISGAGGSLVVVVLAYIDMLTVFGAVLVYFAVVLVALGSSVPSLARDRSESQRHVADRRDRAAKGFWSYSVRNFAASFGLMGNRQVDTFALTLIADSSTIGIYAVATSLVGPIAVIGSSGGLVILPRIAQASTMTDKAIVARRSILKLGAVSAAVAVGVVATAGVLIPLLFGSAFTSAVPVARVLVVGMWAFGMSLVVGAILKGLGSPGAAAIGQLIGMVVTFGLIVGASGGDLMRVAIAAMAGFVVALGFEGTALAVLFRVRRETERRNLSAGDRDD